MEDALLGLYSLINAIQPSGVIQSYQYYEESNLTQLIREWKTPLFFVPYFNYY